MRRAHCAALPHDVGSEFVVEGDEAHHLVRVLRARPGDLFGVFDGAGREVEAEVVSADRRTVTLRVLRELASRTPARDVVLCTAIPRGQRMEWLVEKCTEAGVGRIVPLVTARGVREGASANQQRRWARSALEAAKQCGRADVPVVDDPMSVTRALAGVTLAGVTERSLLLADPNSSAALGACLVEAGPVALFIGPEGGFDDAEHAQIVAAGAMPFALGALILRVETAAVVAVHAAAQ